MKWLAVTLALFAAGCASSPRAGGSAGESDVSTIAGKIVRGQTTKEQVKALYGAPQSTSFTASGDEEWTFALNGSAYVSPDYFFYVRVVPLPDPNQKTLIVVFDKAGRVANYSINDAVRPAGQ